MSLFRYRLIQAFVVISFFAIVSRLFYLQIIQGPSFYKRVKQLHQTVKSEINRGEITDKFGKTLAMDIERYTLEYNPVANSKKENKEELARKLGAIFEFTESSRRLLYSKYSQTLAHNLTREQVKLIKKINSPSLYLRRVITRFYPEDSFASHILGYVDAYGTPRQGVELFFKDTLENHPETKLQLSIDSRLQGFAEDKLLKHIDKTKSAKGSVIVMKVNTGEILAWATVPSFNPNLYQEYKLEDMKNWSLVDVYQPGSIFKTVTVSSALDSKTIDADYKFVDQGYITVDKWRIQNHDYVAGRTKPAELGLTELFQRSSNPFSAHLGLKMGKDVFYEYLVKFGIGAKTNIELPGESSGILRDKSTWMNSDLASTAIGQGAMSVTPIQVLAAINAIANDGVWIKPTIIKLGAENQNLKTRVKVIDPKVAKQVQRMLADSVMKNIKEKHANAGKVEGLKIAGKTGTAQKLENGRYSGYRTVASFIGFFPADNPKYLSLVVIDDPKTDGGWGDTVAGPLFNQVANYCKNLYL